MSLCLRKGRSRGTPSGRSRGTPSVCFFFAKFSVHPLLTSLNSDLTLGYLDDLTLAGPEQTVVLDVQRVMETGGKKGLHLNPSKCEVISHPCSAFTDPVLQSFTPVRVDEAVLLGAPLFPGSALDNTWGDCCMELNRVADRLASLSAKDALLLLRISFSAPRVQHLLRCSPSVDNPGLEKFDSLLRLALTRTANTDILDSQWLQASLPIKDGGLGIRQVCSLALPAYLASAASTA